jgi:hypothetical protein
MMSPRRPVSLMVLTCLAVTVFAVTGCYERVVEADDSYEGAVYEPNLEENHESSRVDDEDEKIQRVDDMD